MANLVKKEQIQAAINDYCAAKEISQNELATKSGVSGATLSKMKNGKWEDIDDKQWRKIEVFITDSAKGKIFTTTDFRTVEKLCKTAQRECLMYGLTADTGIGKTTALEAFSRRKHVFYVPYAKSMSPKNFFAALLKEMAVAFEGNIHQMILKISEEINMLSAPLIIIDEAGKMSHTIIMYLHELRNNTIKNCGIVLAGMPYFKTNLTKFSNKGKEGIPEFYRRIEAWQSLDGLSRAEINNIIDVHGITEPASRASMLNKKRFGDLMNEIRLDQIQNAEI